ncbi:MAG: endolytic transglycosylase MltG [Rhodothermaceae bacterium]
MKEVEENSKNNISRIFLKKRVLFLGTLGTLTGLFFYIFFTPTHYKQIGPVEFFIQKGATLTSVVDQLYKTKVINSKLAFKAAALMSNAETGIKAGRYEIPNGLSYFGLVDLIIKGQPEEATLVTIQEGIWQHNLAKLFAKEMNIDEDEFNVLSKDQQFIKSLGINSSTLEGFLLPDTYYFNNSSTAEDILRKLYRETQKFFNDTLKDKMKARGMTMKEVLTLASIVDGETNIESEFKTIAGVYHNRLKKGMRLQADPTVQYLIRTKRRRANKVYYKDLEIDSPYNTYRNKGLPPSPINNPGKLAILAALEPEKHNYYYFCATGNGGHKFAKTLSEHNKNVRDYRRNRRRKR